ncbi:2-hydroxymuconate tautomerase [Azospirillum sp.]|uniref:2-hydroxymuconate tautomerase n=1 Tax=Azospirillum sp. TaxID=34012 RepID=UPI002D42629F|nr:2-hydroxymuconate tautomerase [Azospirillum sp.]HYD66817.1 2-hydroxymuconate tautomerase [Azospirillum sp.]
MPIARISMMEGRTDEQKEALIREVTDAILRTVATPTSTVTVLIDEIPKKHFGIGGTPASKL